MKKREAKRRGIRNPAFESVDPGASQESIQSLLDQTDNNAIVSSEHNMDNSVHFNKKFRV